MLKNDEHALDVALHLSRAFFGLGEFAQNLMLLLCQIRHEITSGQIHNSK
jgi:hypothetical protein